MSSLSQSAFLVGDSTLSYKIDYAIVIKNFLNPKGHQNPISGSKVTAILLRAYILPIGGASSGRVCACSLRSRLVYHMTQFEIKCRSGGHSVTKRFFFYCLANIFVKDFNYIIINIFISNIFSMKKMTFPCWNMMKCSQTSLKVLKLAIHSVKKIDQNFDKL